LKRLVVIGAAIAVLGSVLVFYRDDDAEHPAASALRITDGAAAWSVSSQNEAHRTVIGASDEVVLIEEGVAIDNSVPIEASGFRSRHTIALNAADGSERWRRSIADTPTPSGPFDGQGIVVLADQDAGALVGVDVLTGKERWSVESSDAPLANSSTVTVVWNGGNPGTPSGLRGIDRLTGEELWVSDTMLQDNSGNSVQRSPAAVFNEIMVFPTGATVTAIDMRTGAILWEAPALDPVAAADGIIVGKRGTNAPGNVITVTALDAASGRERWTAPQQMFQYGDFAVGDGVIVIMDQLTGHNSSIPGLIAYELSSGNERWRVPLTHFLVPQRISGTSLVMRGDRDLAVLSTTDGATTWLAREPFGPLQMISVGSNGDAIFVAINSVPSPCAPRCD
jgi:outer membrane protein assembly factor BamB